MTTVGDLFRRATRPVSYRLDLYPFDIAQVTAWYKWKERTYE